MVGGWRSEISWLLLIHYELLENEESFYRFLTVLLNIDWNYFNVTKFYIEWKTKGILNFKCLQWEMNQIYKNYVREGFKKKCGKFHAWVAGCVRIRSGTKSTKLPLTVVEESSFYCARGKPHFVSKSMDKMRKEVASFKIIVNFKL